MLTRKIQRHDRPLVSAPPRTGPTATATPVTAPKTPNATPRSLPRNAFASSARPVANMIAPPTPWAARARLRNVEPEARPQSSEPSVKTTIPIENSSRRPKRSASEPAVSSSAASDSAYASITHCRSASEASNACSMSGRATFTIVTSSSSMNVPAATATRVHHLRSMPSTLSSECLIVNSPNYVAGDLYSPVRRGPPHGLHGLPAAHRLPAGGDDRRPRVRRGRAPARGRRPRDACRRPGRCRSRSSRCG